MATAIAGGLAFATVLTLVLTPCLLVLRDLRKEKKQENEVLLVQKNESPLKKVSDAA